MPTSPRRSQTTVDDKDEAEQRQNARRQAYDNIIKRLIEGQFETVVPLLFRKLLPLKVERELTIEALVPPRRMDRVYLAQTPMGWAILHLEIEMAPGSRSRIGMRVLTYHALLLEKYNEHPDFFAEFLQGQKTLPVLSMVIYPFAVPAGQPELLETLGQQQILRFQYQELCMRHLSAAEVFAQHEVPLYAFLPAMYGVTREILMSAITEMVQYYHELDDTLREEMLCFLIFLNRASPLPKEDMEELIRRIRMYDPLLEADPWVQEYSGRRHQEGLAEGLAEGRAQEARKTLQILVRLRYPGLLDLAVDRLARLDGVETLEKAFQALCAASAEEEARRLLLSLPQASSQGGPVVGLG